MQKQPTKNKSKNCCTRCLIGTSIYILVLLLLMFVIIFVIVPVVFKYSAGIQKSLIFPTWLISPKNYSDIEAFGIKGVRNFYVNLENDDNVTLGIWQILPEEILSDVIENNDYNYDGMLVNGNYNILLYMHGNGEDRAAALEMYQILRKHFHIFAVDYRGYADSSKADLTESGMVNDIGDLYKWLMNRAKNSKIFVWGHSLGSGIGTHLISNLKKEDIMPHGLILETPFTSITDVVETSTIVKIYSFIPWFSITILQPIIDNDLNFNSAKYIIDVDCPIMILHAKDDTIIPYNIATELYNIAVNNRNSSYQGNVTYHLFDALGYNHMMIFKAPELPIYINDFVQETAEYERKFDFNTTIKSTNVL